MNKLLSFINTIATLALIVMLVIVDLLPFNILVAICAILFVIMLLINIMILHYRAKSRLFIGSLFAIIAIFINSALTYYLFTSNNFIYRLAGQKVTLDIVDLKNQGIDDLKQLTNRNIMSVYSNKEIITNNYQYYSDKDLTVSFDNDYKTLVNQLYEGNYEAILINKANLKQIEELYPTFNDDILILDTASFKLARERETDINKQPFTIYVSGVDDDMEAGSNSTRTDTNILVTYNPKTGNVLMTSIPRDLYVPIYCDGLEGEYYDKFTHTGIGGIDCSIDTIENYLGVKIDYYARIGFEGMVELVDSLGGITVNNPNDFYTNEGVFFQYGAITLNG
ncbi:MAG: LCP family protein, partial [Bacilli bacterium]